MKHNAKWLRPKEVRNLYNVTSDAKLCMQLKRFDGKFPKKRGGAGKKNITTLQITDDLDAYLTRLNMTQLT